LVLENNVGHEFGVTLVGARAVSWTNWVVEDVYHAPVIACNNEFTGFVTATFVNVSSIYTFGETSFSFPGQRASGSHPGGTLKFGTSTGVLLTFFSIPEKKLVVTGVRSDPLVVFRPVKSCDVAVVSNALSNQGPVFGFVDINVVVMRTDSEHAAIGRE